MPLLSFLVKLFFNKTKILLRQIMSYFKGREKLFPGLLTIAIYGIIFLVLMRAFVFFKPRCFCMSAGKGEITDVDYNSK
jgi:hypothetical protein